MPSDVANAGFRRVSELIVRMLVASENKDKDGLMVLADSFGDDASDLVAVLMDDAGVTEDDLVRHAASNDDSLLVKEASEAPRMQKEAREE
jgi:hypothetical protein